VLNTSGVVIDTRTYREETTRENDSLLWHEATR